MGLREDLVDPCGGVCPGSPVRLAEALRHARTDDLRAERAADTPAVAWDDDQNARVP